MKTPSNLIGAESWREIAAGCADKQLMEYILTDWQRKGWNDMACPLWQWLSPTRQGLRLLDLGCGIGRTLRELRSCTNWHLTGYDTPEMIARARQGILPDVTWESDWGVIAGQPFDCVHACFVFQHVSPLAMRQYCMDLPKMTSMVVVRGRDWNDHTRGPTADLLVPLLEAGFTVREMERDGDHATHVYLRG
jgi:SAM-dependent methyltransferase